jgi:hypothetical protein
MDQPLFDLTKPIVFNRGKKKKRKYSRGLRGLQVNGRRMSKVTSRIMRSTARGFDTFRKASDKSAQKKRDGALLDLNRNIAKGISRSLRESSRIPRDLAHAVDTRWLRRSRRRQLRVLSRFNRTLGIR